MHEGRCGVIPVLSLVGLAFASTSDGESSEEISSEQKWTHWFEEADRLRAEFHARPMTPQERMKAMLGEWFPSGYGLSYLFPLPLHGMARLHLVLLAPECVPKADHEEWNWRTVAFQEIPESIWQNVPPPSGYTHSESLLDSTKATCVVRDWAERMFVYPIWSQARVWDSIDDSTLRYVLGHGVMR